MVVDYKSLLAIIAAALSVYGYSAYMLATIKRTNKPHVFSWIIWTLLSGIVFAAQLSDGAGPGAWPTGITMLLSLIIACLAFRVGEKHITRSDWLMFSGGLVAIPLWRATGDPATAAIVVTFINTAAFYPTFRKAWHKPHEEYAMTYGLNAARHIITLLAIVNYSIATSLYTVALIFINGGMYAFLHYRRRLSAR